MTERATIVISDEEREKRRSRNRRWAADNPDRVLASRRKYYAANRERLIAETIERRKPLAEEFRWVFPP